MVRDLVRAVIGDVADRDAGRLRGRPVDLVHPDAVAQDPDGPFQAGDAVRVEPAVAGDDDGIRGPDRVVGRGGILGHDQSTPRLPKIAVSGPHVDGPGTGSKTTTLGRPPDS